MSKFGWNTFGVFLLIFQLGNCYAGKVFFLHGSGCAGKTSLCREILQKSDDWRVVSEDDIYYEKAAIHWENEFPEEFEEIKGAIEKENILHAVMRNQVLFRTNISEWQKKRAMLAIRVIQQELNSRPKSTNNDDPNSWSYILRAYIANEIKDIAKNKNVIVDTWFLKQEHIDEIAQQYEVRHIVAYCSFFNLIKRTLERNHNAIMNGKDISNLRFFHQALNSFTEIYDFSDIKDNSVDELIREDVVHGCDIVALCLNDSSSATGATKTFTRGEFSLSEFKEYQRNLLDKFKGNKVYVYPKRKVDSVVRTDHNTASECAKKIIELAELL